MVFIDSKIMYNIFMENGGIELKLYKEKKNLYTSLSIAGSDCSGGAGIQADIKTMTMNGVYAMSAITALTSQNTTGVRDILEVDKTFLESQLDSIFTDIFPDSIKIGMIPNSEMVVSIYEKIKEYSAKNIVLDPVISSSSGTRFQKSGVLKAIEEYLLPIVDLVTPNIPEAEILSGIKIRDREDMVKSAEKISKYGASVLLKGGHFDGDSDDLLYISDKKIEYDNFTRNRKDGKNNVSIDEKYDLYNSDSIFIEDKNVIWIKGTRIDNQNTHGTGCTLSSAIASNLARGMDLQNACVLAKRYITGAILSGVDMGKGTGPLNHMFEMDD